VFTITPPPHAEPPVGLDLATRLADGAGSKINTLSWLDNPENKAIELQSYRIFRKQADAPGSAVVLIASVSPQTHSYEDANLPFARKFTYGMTALGRNGVESDGSEFVTEISVFPPLAARVATVVNSSLFRKETLSVVSWEDNPLNIPVAVVRYNIYRKKSDQDDSKFAMIAWVISSAFEYRDRKLATGADFVYRVTAVDASGTESAHVTAIR
jgi:fibronectin type 3 domain-containing protein